MHHCIQLIKEMATSFFFVNLFVMFIMLGKYGKSINKKNTWFISKEFSLVRGFFSGSSGFPPKSNTIFQLSNMAHLPIAKTKKCVHGRGPLVYIGSLGSIPSTRFCFGYDKRYRWVNIYSPYTNILHSKIYISIYYFVHELVSQYSKIMNCKLLILGN